MRIRSTTHFKFDTRITAQKLLLLAGKPYYSKSYGSFHRSNLRSEIIMNGQEDTALSREASHLWNIDCEGPYQSYQ